MDQIHTIAYRRPPVVPKGSVPGKIIVWTYLSFFLLPVILIVGALAVALFYGILRYYHQ